MDRLRALLVEDDPDHAGLVAHRLRKFGSAVTLEHVMRLKDALDHLRTKPVDVVLLDLGLPDVARSNALSRVIGQSPNVPVVVLTALDDLEFATTAVQNGAQDYLVKSELSGELLMRSIRYAVERNRILRELERSNAELRRFAHTVAHEIRNPLNTCSISVSLIRTVATEDDVITPADRALRAVRGLSDLVGALLEFSEVGGDAGGDFRAVALEEALEDALEEHRWLLDESGARVSAESLPAVRGDPVQLRHLLGNLICNAVKYRGDARPEVRVTAERDPDGWLVSVIDNGVGIAPEDRERVFEMFTRVGAREKTPGTGIGLAFCKRIVEHHGGRIWVEAAPGGGCSVCFTLQGSDAGDQRPRSDEAPAGAEAASTDAGSD